MDYFWIPSAAAKYALLKRRISLAASIVGDGQAFSAAAAGTNDTDDDDDNCNLEVAVGLDDVERFGSKCRA